MKKIDWKDEMIRIEDKLYPCGTSVAMSIIGGKWKMVIVHHLKERPLRFSALRKQLKIVTERTLSLQLKQLEEDGIVLRKVYTEKAPLKVEYSLTELGESLIPVLEAVGAWGNAIARERGERVKT